MENEKNVFAWASTTHAENTQENTQTLCVDWVTTSFRTALNVQQVFNFLGVSQLENMEVISGARYGFAGYDTTYKLGTIELMRDTKEERYLLNMSGQACREYETLSGYTFDVFFALLTHFYATYTRLDIAVDVYNGLFNVNTFRRAVMKKQVCTRLKEWGNYQKGLVEAPEVLTMDSFYLGSRSSRYFINVYDKKLERTSKKMNVERESWTRFEIRLSGEYAEQIIHSILRTNGDDLGEQVYSFLNEKIQVLKLSVAQTTKNKSRSAKDYGNHARWWRSFLNTTNKLKLTVYQPDMPLMASKGWLLDKVSTTLSLFKMYYTKEEFEEFIEELDYTGFDKMSKKHIKRLEQQVLLDEQLAAGTVNIDWIKNDASPVIERVQTLSAYNTKKEKQGFHARIMDSYWQTVALQQENEKKSTDITPIDS